MSGNPDAPASTAASSSPPSTPPSPAPVPVYEDYNGARFPAVLEPTGRSAVEQYGEKLREAEVFLSLQVKTWPEWRQRVSRFVRFNPWFERAIFGLIVLNAMTITLDSIVEGTTSPTESLRGLSVAVNVMDNFVTWAFVLEMFAKLVAYGFWSKGCGYFSNAGDCVDFVINVFSVYATIQELTSSVDLGNAASAVRSVRLLRTFRAVKALRHLRLLVDALFVALRRLADVGLLYLVFITFMVFIGLQLFQGRYARNCIVPVQNATGLYDPINKTLHPSVVHVSAGRNNGTVFWKTTKQVCAIGMPQDAAETLARLPRDQDNYTWLEPFADVNYLFSGYVCPYGQWCKEGLQTPERNQIGFENIYFALTTLMTVSVYENWTVIMYSAIFARGYAASWYFLAVVFVGSIFVLNLVLAILTDAFTQSLTVLRKDLDEQIAIVPDTEDSGGVVSTPNDAQDGADDEDSAPLIAATPADKPTAASDDSAAQQQQQRSRSASVGPRDAAKQQRPQRTLLQNSLALSVSNAAHSRKFSHTSANFSRQQRRAALDDPDAGRDFEREQAEFSERARRRRYSQFGGGDGDSVPVGGHQVNRRSRSYSLVNELRRKVHTNRNFHAVDAGGGSPARVTEEELDHSLDWLSNEWALVVLEARKNEDLETMAASELNEQQFANDGSWRDVLHGKYRRLQSWLLQNVIATPIFSGLGVVLTVVNVVILSIVFPDMDDAFRTTLQSLSIILSMIFVLESIVRVIGLGWHTFARDPFNIIDGVLALVALFELGFAGSTVISAVRTIRLMRVMSYFPSVVATLRTLAAAVRASASLMVQLMIIIFVMAVLGQQLFRGELCGLDEDPPFLGVTRSKLCTTPGRTTAPAFNFDSLASAVVTVFIVVAGDGWRQFWVDCSARTTPYHALYFIGLYVIGNYLFVNLFVAVLIDAASQSRAAGEEEQRRQLTTEPGNENSLQNVAAAGTTVGAGAELEAGLGSRSSGDAASSAAGDRATSKGDLGDGNNDGNNSKTAAEMDAEKDFDALPDERLNYLQLWHRRHVSREMRVFAARIVLSTPMKTAVAMTSFAASISYYFWADACAYPDHWSSSALDAIEVIAALVSTADSFLRWCALGRTCSYLVQFINFVSYFTILFQFVPIPSRSVVVSICRVFTRAIRPWTYALRFARFRLVFYSLVRAVSALRSVALVAVLFWFTYGVLGAQLFCGKMSACTKGRLEFDWGDQTYLNKMIQNESECLANNYTWQPYKYNFDNVGNSMLALVTAATTDDWSNLMYLTTGVESSDVAPEPGKYLAYSVFLSSFVVVMAFFLINVIVSVLVDAYFTTKAQMEDNAAKLSDAKIRDRQLEGLADEMAKNSTANNNSNNSNASCAVGAAAAGTDAGAAQAAASGSGSSGQPKTISLDCQGELDVLSEAQQDYFDMAMHVLLLVKPTMPVFFGQDSWRWRIRSLIRSRWFNYVYLLLALVDFTLQATQFMEYPPMTAWALLHCDTAMSVLLLVMTACRILGNSCWGFLSMSSNVLELGVNVVIFAANLLETISFAVARSQGDASAVNEVMTDAGTMQQLSVADAFKRFQQMQALGMVLAVLRNLRMLRFQRVLSTFHGVRVIIFTLRTSARNFIGGLTLVFLVYYFFASLAVAMFGRVVDNGSGLSSMNNFRTIPLAMLGLVRVATLDDWEGVMRSCGLAGYPCESRLGNCGSPWLATPFFYLFMVFGQWIAMMCFVAILLDSFSKAERHDRFAVQRADVDRFRKLWKMFADPKSQLLSVAKLPMLLQRLGPGLAIEEEGYVAAQTAERAATTQSGLMARIEEALGVRVGDLAASPPPPSSGSGMRRSASGAAVDGNVEMSGGGDGDDGGDADRARVSPVAPLPGDDKHDPDDDDFDDADAGNEFVRAVLIKKAVDRGSLSTRFCSLRRAQAYLRELRVSSRDASFSGVVTQRQVFEACVKHHYAVPLPASYEASLEQQFEQTFPVDHFRLTRALAGGDGQGMMKLLELPNGERPAFDALNTDHLLHLIRLQVWWREVRLRRVVRAAIKKAKADGKGGRAQLAEETARTIQALMTTSSRSNLDRRTSSVAPAAASAAAAAAAAASSSSSNTSPTSDASKNSKPKRAAKPKAAEDDDAAGSNADQL